MQIVALHHVQLAMPPDGEDRARDFYGHALGLTEIDKPPHLKKRGGCWFELGPVRVHLGVEAGFRPARKAHPAFQVADLAKLARRLAQAGYPTKSDEPLPGYTRLYVDDPFGNRIELLEPVGEGTRSV